MKFQSLIFAVIGVSILTISEVAEAATISFDEVTDTVSGDYSELGGSNNVGEFDLDAGVNSFFGSIVTPGDPSDTFNITIGENERLTSVNFNFGLNGNSLAINQNTQLLISPLSGTGEPVLDLAITRTGGFSAPSDFFLETGSYNVLLRTEVLALRSGAGPRYRLDFGVEEEAEEIPEVEETPEIVAIPESSNSIGILIATSVMGLIFRKSGVNNFSSNQ